MQENYIKCCLCDKPSHNRYFHDMKVYDYCDEHLPISIEGLKDDTHRFKTAIEDFLLYFHDLEISCPFCSQENLDYNKDHCEDCPILRLIEVVEK